MKPVSSAVRLGEEPGADSFGSSPLIGGDVSLQAVAWVLDFSKSSGLEKLVLIYLANYHNLRAKVAWPSIQTIAESAGVSESTVKRALVTLEELGEIEIVKRRKDGRDLSNFYRLPIFESKRERDFRESGKGFPESPEGFPENPMGFQESYNPVIEPVKEPVREKPLIFSDVKKFEEELERKRQHKEKREARKRGERIFQKPLRQAVPSRPVASKPPETWNWFAKMWRRYTDVFPVGRPEHWETLEKLYSDYSATGLEDRLSRWMEQRDHKTNAWSALEFLNECPLMDEKEAGDIQSIVNEE